MLLGGGGKDRRRLPALADEFNKAIVLLSLLLIYGGRLALTAGGCSARSAALQQAARSAAPLHCSKPLESAKASPRTHTLTSFIIMIIKRQVDCVGVGRFAPCTSSLSSPLAVHVLPLS